jgi:hypothetical protein
MTKWQAFPLRKPGEAWSGIDVKSGKLDDGRALLTEESINVQVNRKDLLEKRKGFIRALNERFGTVVCGLHTYTDICGNEWLLVASDDGIAIRHPGVILPGTPDDSYPTDNFSTTLSELNWRNTALYTATGDVLLRVSGSSTAPFDAAGYLRWFKDASAMSYEVQLEYEFTPGVAGKQVVSVAIKGSGDLLTGAYLQADLEFTDGGAYLARLYHVTAARQRQSLGQIDVAGSRTSPGGFFTLAYRRLFSPTPTFVPFIEVVPIGGALQELAGATLQPAQDLDLGQVSAIGCSLNASILAVSGGSL